MSEMRLAAAMVAHVLHTPMSAIEEADIADLLEWAEDAAALVSHLYGKRRAKA